MATTEKIRVYLASLAPGDLFSTQGLIHLGPRSAVDSALSRLCKEGLLQRMAWGVYANTPDKERYTNDPLQTALVKSQAFNKTIFPYSQSIVDLLKMSDIKAEAAPDVTGQKEDSEIVLSHSAQTEPDVSLGGQGCGGKVALVSHARSNNVPVEAIFEYFSTGSGANFRCLETPFRVKCISLSQKKIRSYLLEGGYWVSAIRFLGQKSFLEQMDELKAKLPPSRTTLASLKESFELMPGWLYSNLNVRYAQRYDLRKHPLVEIPQPHAPVPKKHLEFIWGPAYF